MCLGLHLFPPPRATFCFPPLFTTPPPYRAHFSPVVVVNTANLSCSTRDPGLTHIFHARVESNLPPTLLSCSTPWPPFPDVRIVSSDLSPASGGPNCSTGPSFNVIPPSVCLEELPVNPRARLFSLFFLSLINLLHPIVLYHRFESVSQRLSLVCILGDENPLFFF